MNIVVLTEVYVRDQVAVEVIVISMINSEHTTYSQYTPKSTQLRHLINNANCASGRAPVVGKPPSGASLP